MCKCHTQTLITLLNKGVVSKHQIKFVDYKLIVSARGSHNDVHYVHYFTEKECIPSLWLISIMYTWSHDAVHGSWNSIWVVNGKCRKLFGRLTVKCPGMAFKNK